MSSSFHCCGYSEDVQEILRDEPDSNSVRSPHKKTFRQRLYHLLHTNGFQIGVVVLVIIDCLFVTSELILDLSAYSTRAADRGPNAEHEKQESLELGAAKILHILSLSVLCIFIVELIIKLYAFGLAFFKHKLEVFDAVVVIVSFTLDLIFLDEETSAGGGIGLLIILRLWRVARIMNGMVLSVQTRAHKRELKERTRREAAEQRLEIQTEYSSRLCQEISVLRKLCDANNIDHSGVARAQSPNILRRHGDDFVADSANSPINAADAGNTAVLNVYESYRTPSERSSQISPPPANIHLSAHLDEPERL